jgi:hypothetical protein
MNLCAKRSLLYTGIFLRSETFASFLVCEYLRGERGTSFRPSNKVEVLVGKNYPKV